MKEKPWPRKCTSCREYAVNQVVEDYTTTLQHDGRPFTITVPSLTITICAACGNRNRDYDADDRLVTALRTAAGILQPEEIRSKRLALGITQKQLAAHLDIAEETLSRWETGGQLQQRGYDGLLRLYFDLPTVREYCAARSGEKAASTSRTEIAA